MNEVEYDIPVLLNTADFSRIRQGFLPDWLLANIQDAKAPVLIHEDDPDRPKGATSIRWAVVKYREQSLGGFELIVSQDVPKRG